MPTLASYNLTVALYEAFPILPFDTTLEMAFTFNFDFLTSLEMALLFRSFYLQTAEFQGFAQMAKLIFKFNKSEIKSTKSF